MKLGLIGNGAIARYAAQSLKSLGHDVAAILVRPNRVDDVRAIYGSDVVVVSAIAQMPSDLDLIVECAGHQALHQYGAEALQSGFSVVTVSIGALADQALATALQEAATRGQSALHLASGAIGGLDALRAARAGALSEVRYIGRKPPLGWRGSPAEDVLDLDQPMTQAQTHFTGTAREAALAYPKNANVAAAVALSSLGLDDTQVALIADPTVTTNIHEVHATGAFGTLHVTISGNALPENPKSSALAAMSVVSKVEDLARAIRF
jgi:aspartate dehydrogenase